MKIFNLPALVVGVMLFSSAAGAEVLYGLEAEVGFSKTEVAGSVGTHGTAGAGFPEQELSNPFVNFKVEHPVPMVPNVRFGVESYDFIVQANPGFSGLLIDSSNGVELSAVEFTGTLYYELLDNVVNLDVGVSAKNVMLEVATVEVLNGDMFDTADWAPMLYVNAEVELPVVDIRVGLTAEGTGLSDELVNNADFYVGYSLVDLFAFDVSFKAGYRIKSLLVDVQSSEFDLEQSSVYGSVSFRF